jgi:hypothetical protein
MATKPTRIYQGPRFVSPAYTVRVRGESGCAIYGHADGVIPQARCYLSTRPTGTVDVSYSELCAHCSGAGRVRANRRTLAWKPCKVCNGVPKITPDTVIATYTADTLPPI